MGYRRPAGCIKLLFYGPPGTGKTPLAQLVGRALVTTPYCIEELNGKLLNLDHVREMQRALALSNLYGDWSVKIVNPLDRASRDAQDLLLTVLDELRPGRAFLATSNLNLDELTPQLQSRFQTIRVDPPELTELADFLRAVFS